jgi:hypothetical protein
MTALCVRSRAGFWPFLWLTAGLFLAAIAAPARADDPIVVHLDQARILKIPDRSATVVIGNPLIADISIQTGGVVVLTGKSYGATNVIVMDRSGAVLLEHNVEVRGPSDPVVFVFRGETRQTYSCTPDCAPRITPADDGMNDFSKTPPIDDEFFNKALEHAAARNAQALAGGSSGLH